MVFLLLSLSRSIKYNQKKCLVSNYSRNKIFENFLTIYPKLIKTKPQTHFCKCYWRLTTCKNSTLIDTVCQFMSSMMFFKKLLECLISHHLMNFTLKEDCVTNLEIIQWREYLTWNSKFFNLFGKITNFAIVTKTFKTILQIKSNLRFSMKYL